MSDDVKQRCPHDGGACHHKCEGRCYRYASGMALSSPWPGFPSGGTAPIPVRVLCTQCDRPKATNADEVRAGACPREWARHDRAAEEDCEAVAHAGPQWSVRPSTSTSTTSTVTLTLTCTLEDAAKVKLFAKLRELGFQVKE